MISWAFVSVPSAIAVIVQCVCGLNAMTIRTAHSVRLVYLGFLLSAAAGALSPLYGQTTQAWEAVTLALLAIWLRVNRRRTYHIGPAT